MEYFATAPWQKRDNLVEDSRLAHVAHMRAMDLCARDYFSHETPDGFWPNHYVRLTGYKIPEWYKDNGNQVESLAKGYLCATDALDAWERSPNHHDHVTGSGFWASHTIFGVGIFECETGPLYALITAPPEPAENKHIFIPWIGGGTIVAERQT